jgi:UDP-N-acetylmuramate--alanine ligase
MHASSAINDTDAWKRRRLHFVGIGGAGMSGLALIARTLGAAVTGSDRTESSYLVELRASGVEPVLGPHAAANVPAGAEVVYSTAIPADNPEREVSRAFGGGGELHRSELLAQLASLKRCLAVTGTHGKTTTTGMVVHVLRGCGLDPAYAVGGELRSTGTNAGWGAGEWIVIEADESDRSLLRFDPEIAVLTNAELDHHSTYSSLLDLQNTFREFTGRARAAVVWDRPELIALARDGGPGGGGPGGGGSGGGGPGGGGPGGGGSGGGAGEVVPYDAPEPQLSPAGTRFLWRGHEVTLAVPGAHNAVNAAGALTAAVLAGASPEAAVAAIASFEGARRRMELVGSSAAGALVYDDYAHHPTEVRAALAAARTLAPRRLVAVFQPHLYSRTRALAGGFGQALAAADVCGVVDVYPARERAEDFPGVDGHLVAAAAADAAGGRPVGWMRSLDDARRWLDSILQEGDLCLLMGAGNIDSLGRSLVV